MAFVVDSFKADPPSYLGTKQFLTPGSSVGLDSVDITERTTVTGSEMEVVTFSNRTSLKHFNAAAAAKITVTASSTDSGDFRAYWLPWKSGYAYRMTLGATASCFITAKMNSCGIIIGGERATPTVIHANTEDVTTPDFTVGMDPVEYGRTARSIQTTEYKLAYGGLAAAAIEAGWFGGGTPNVSVIDPEFYLTDTLMSMSVFGVLNGGNWTFYANLHLTSGAGKTLEIWPNQPRSLPTG